MLELCSATFTQKTSEPQWESPCLLQEKRTEDPEQHQIQGKFEHSLQGRLGKATPLRERSDSR
ncbi:hypothetical protein MPNT_230044 [Candidatus Methylacidithermus pantelleriae]|uniref:Uncharacterized protein n=1 Tax=Candidatus Methylacidithermus pantelleriae TaxID=2744239 RepID=A0A8J2BIK6_9BACT|nr:hypothetical protein MPNT_230044 [Candidatus Methylacidithermus pantelleriae]